MQEQTQEKYNFVFEKLLPFNVEYCDKDNEPYLYKAKLKNLDFVYVKYYVLGLMDTIQTISKSCNDGEIILYDKNNNITPDTKSLTNTDKWILDMIQITNVIKNEYVSL